MPTAAEYATFAIRYKISPAVAYVLPALIERTAQMAGLEPRAMLSKALYNAPLGQYLADAAHKVAEADQAA